MPGHIHLPSSADDAAAAATRSSSLRWMTVLAIAALIGLVASPFDVLEVLPGLTTSSSKHGALPRCPPQVEPLSPKATFVSAGKDEYAERLAQFVRIPTVSYDDNGKPAEDPRWDVFEDAHQWLFETYPRVFNHPATTITKVNTLALLIEIKGTDASLKPLMLTSHIDVVPVEQRTLDRWTYPPFDGHYDGEYIWGRGAGDCKSLLTAQYEALSQLLSSGFIPKRTIVLSHGFDEEEVQARQGAGELSKFIEAKYGKDSMLLVLDEGGSSVRLFDTALAIPATSEKGYVDIEINVGTPGGHSSIPPDHSGIGIMSEIVRAIEKSPWEASYDGADDPLLQLAMCATEHARKKVPSSWLHAIKRQDWQGLARAFATVDNKAKALVTTTQAVDIIRGGAKVNALPELVTAVVNHRIAFSHSIADVQKHLTKVIAPVADRFNMPFHPFEDSEVKLGERYITVGVQGLGLEPAPRSPTTGAVWDMFAGSARHSFKDSKHGDTPYIISPGASTGNSDTKVYWALSRNIFRFGGSLIEDYESNIHTVNEKISIKNHIATIGWIHTIVQNADAFDETAE